MDSEISGAGCAVPVPDIERLPDDFQAFEQVGQAIDIPLAQGENLHTLLEFRSALETGVLAFPEPDASNIGGITGWVKVVIEL